MNPLYTEFKRKFSFSMYKNMGISLGEMNFLKDFVNDTRGDLYPLVEKSEGCVEQVSENRYRVLKGSAERVFCQLFPFATYELNAESVNGSLGFVFRLPTAVAYVGIENGDNGVSFSYRCGDRAERIDVPDGASPCLQWLVTLRPGFFDIYCRRNGRAEHLYTVSEPLFSESNRYAEFKDGNVSLYASGEVSVISVVACLDNGVSIADFRAVRYEDGSVIRECGKIWFTASIRTEAGNYQAILSWVPGTMQMEMTGALFFDSGDGFWRGYIASILLYNRMDEKWYVWTSTFAHEHILAYGQFDGDPRFGVNVADVTVMQKANEDTPETEFLGFVHDEDPDLIYDRDNDRWILAICRLSKQTKKYVYMFFESKDPFEGFRYIGCGVEGASETGGSFLRVDGEIFFVCGNSFERRSEYRIYGKNGMKNAAFRYPDGGFRGWGCVIPVTLGSRTRYFWLTFDRHNGSAYNWSYGNIYCFEAE
jgi:hypothetical protein